MLVGPLLLVAAISLSGCAAQAPEATGSDAPSSAAPVEPAQVERAVTVLRFSGSDLKALDADGQPVETAVFADGVEPAVALLADALGVEPEVTEQPEQCAGAHTSYAWDGVALVAWAGSADLSFTVRSAASGDVRLETVGGFAVGDDVSSFVESQPAENVARPGGSDVFVAFDVVSAVTAGDYTSPLGAVGYLPDGATLDTLITPGQWSSFLC